MEQQLMMLRVQLFAALQMCKGDDLLNFKQLLFDVVQSMDDSIGFRARLETDDPYIKER